MAMERQMCTQFLNHIYGWLVIQTEKEKTYLMEWELLSKHE